MVLTVLEARVATEKWAAMQQAYEAGTGHLPPQMLQTFLIQSATEPNMWRIISVWRSREALEEMRRSTETPAGVLMFRSAGAEPALSIFRVAAHMTGSSGS